MYVGRIMHTELITVSPETSLVEARDILAEKRIDHLLVVDKRGDLIGLVSDRDIKQSWASPATTFSNHELNYLIRKVTVGMIMVKRILTITPGTTIERAAMIMQENRISALPVLGGGRLMGIITTTDVMGVLLGAIGIDQDSTRFTVLADDRIGFIAELSQVLKENRINIRSLFAWPDKKYPCIHQLVIRVSAQAGARAVSLLKESGFKVITEYVEDLTPYLPAA